jgi:hypothetical protein
MFLQFLATTTTPICTLFNTSLWFLLAINSNLGSKLKKLQKDLALLGLWVMDASLFDLAKVISLNQCWVVLDFHEELPIQVLKN